MVRFVIFFLFLSGNIFSGFREIMHFPKEYFFQLKDRLTGINLRQGPIGQCIKKHPVISFKIAHESFVLFYNLLYMPHHCKQGCSRYRHLKKAFIDFELYDHFFSYLLSFEKEYCSTKNLFSSSCLYPQDQRQVIPRWRKYILSPGFAFFADMYTLFRKLIKKN